MPKSSVTLFRNTQRSGSQASQSAPGRGEVGLLSAPGRPGASPAKPALVRLAADPTDAHSKTPNSRTAALDTPPVVSYAHEAAKAVASLAAAVAA
jgi:hypothetical protein